LKRYLSARCATHDTYMPELRTRGEQYAHPETGATRGGCSRTLAACVAVALVASVGLNVAMQAEEETQAERRAVYSSDFEGCAYARTAPWLCDEGVKPAAAAPTPAAAAPAATPTQTPTTTPNAGGGDCAKIPGGKCAPTVYNEDTRRWESACPPHRAGKGCAIACSICAGAVGAGCAMNKRLQAAGQYGCRCLPGFVGGRDFRHCVNEIGFNHVWDAPGRRLHGVPQSRTLGPKGGCVRPVSREAPLRLELCTGPVGGAAPRGRPRTVIHKEVPTQPFTAVMTVPSTAGKVALVPGKPVVWLYLSGHARTLLLNVARLKSMLRRMSPNFFVAISVWDQLDTDTTVWWSNKNGGGTPGAIDMQKLLEDVVCGFDGRAVAEAVHRHTRLCAKDQVCNGGQTVLWPRVHDVAQRAAVQMGVGLSESDVVIKSRPDVMFGYAFDAAALRKHFIKVPRSVFMMQHDSFNVPTGYDISECAWVTSGAGYARAAAYMKTHLGVAGDSYEELVTAGRIHYLAEPGRYKNGTLIALPDDHKPMSSAYLRPDATIFFHRLGKITAATNKLWADGAVLDMAVINPGGVATTYIPRGTFAACPMRLQDPVPEFLLDATRGSMCVLGRVKGDKNWKPAFKGIKDRFATNSGGWSRPTAWTTQYKLHPPSKWAGCVTGPVTS